MFMTEVLHPYTKTDLTCTRSKHTDTIMFGQYHMQSVGLHIKHKYMT